MQTLKVLLVRDFMAAGLEEKLNQFISFEDPVGFRRTLFQYLRHLVTHQMEVRLKDVSSPVKSILTCKFSKKRDFNIIKKNLLIQKFI